MWEINHLFHSPSPSFSSSLPPSLSTFPGLLALQNSDSLLNASGFRNLETVGTLVLANMGTVLNNFDGFNSLFEATILIITRNDVSHYYIIIMIGLFIVIRMICFSIGYSNNFWIPKPEAFGFLPAYSQP